MGRTVGYFSPLQACLVPAGTMQASPRVEDIQVSSSPGVSELCASNVCYSSAMGTYLPPMGGIGAMTVAYMFWESLGQTWPTTSKKNFMPDVGGFC